MKKILKWVVSPLILALLLITYSAHAVLHWVKFLCYGGEFVRYMKDDRASMEKILAELKLQKPDGNE